MYRCVWGKIRDFPESANHRNNLVSFLRFYYDFFFRSIIRGMILVGNVITHSGFIIVAVKLWRSNRLFLIIKSGLWGRPVSNTGRLSADIIYIKNIYHETTDTVSSDPWTSLENFLVPSAISDRPLLLDSGDSSRYVDDFSSGM